MSPWNNDTIAAVNELRADNEVQYTNLVGSGGIIMLPAGANVSEVRAALANLSSEVTVNALCDVNGVINFTLTNGTVVPQAPGSISLSLDPYSQIGDEISLKITADISNAGITDMVATPVPFTNESKTNATVNCSDVYQVMSAVAWNKRDINISAIASELNVSNKDINYSRNDAVTFSRPLNNSEINGIKAENLSYVYNILAQGLEANITNESLITAITGELSDVTPTFQPSPIIIDVGGNTTIADATSLINENGGEVELSLRGCKLTLNDEIEVNGMQMLVSPNIRQLNYLINSTDVQNNNGNLSVLGNASYIGRIVTKFDIIGIN